MIFLMKNLPSIALVFIMPFQMAEKIEISLALHVRWFICIFSSTKRTGWANMRRLTLVAGAQLIRCWSGFTTLVTQHGPATIPSHGGRVAVFIAILALLWWKLRTNAAGAGFAGVRGTAGER